MVVKKTIQCYKCGKTVDPNDIKKHGLVYCPEHIKEYLIVKDKLNEKIKPKPMSMIEGVLEHGKRI